MNIENTNKEFLKPKELAQIWGISEKTLQAWRTAGTGPEYLKVGHFIHYYLDDLKTYMQNIRYRGTSEKIDPVITGGDNGK